MKLDPGKYEVLRQRIDFWITECEERAENVEASTECAEGIVFATVEPLGQLKIDATVVLTNFPGQSRMDVWLTETLPKERL